MTDKSVADKTAISPVFRAKAVTVVSQSITPLTIDRPLLIASTEGFSTRTSTPLSLSLSQCSLALGSLNSANTMGVVWKVCARCLIGARDNRGPASKIRCLIPGPFCLDGPATLEEAASVNGVSTTGLGDDAEGALGFDAIEITFGVESVGFAMALYDRTMMYKSSAISKQMDQKWRRRMEIFVLISDTSRGTPQQIVTDFRERLLYVPC